MTRTARQKRLRKQRRERLEHCPSGKIAFNSKLSAEIYMSSVSAPVIRAYQCPTCTDWHLTKSRDRDRV